MRYTANQPRFLGGEIFCWNRYACVGSVLHLTTALYSHGSPHNTITLLDSAGKSVRITAPRKHADQQLSLDSVQFHDPARTVKKFSQTFQSLYGRSPHYRALREEFEALLGSMTASFRSLAGFNLLVLGWVKGQLGLRFAEVLDTDHVRRPEHGPSEWLSAVGSTIGGKEYLTGGSADDEYLDRSCFQGRGIVVSRQAWKMGSYLRSPGILVSVPQVSILDPLFSVGAEATRELISGAPY